MKNWKTTASGALTAFFGFVAVSPALFSRWPWLVEFAKYVALGGMASFGFAAKDKDVTGGSRPQ